MSRSCAIYARVSTSKAEQAKSVPDQLAECRRYAQRLGLQVVAEYRDDGVSGRKGRDQRQGWDQLLRWIEAGGLPGGGVVLTWDLDRWSRDFADGLIEALQLHKRGVSIADTKDGVVSLDTLVGQVMLALKVAGAAEYVAKLSRAVKRSMESKVVQGFWMWPRPYGVKRHPPLRTKATSRFAHPPSGELTDRQGVASHLLRWATAGVPFRPAA